MDNYQKNIEKAVKSFWKTKSVNFNRVQINQIAEPWLQVIKWMDLLIY